MKTLEELLTASASLHKHLCPRQVLGVRMGMYASELLGINLPQADKRVLTIIETDGCFADGVSAATGCWVGRRTLRVQDYGKIAATFVDTQDGRVLRIAPQQDVRQQAARFAPPQRSRWHTQLIGYQNMPAELLFSWQLVVLATPIEQIINRAGVRATCDLCQEEIINGREIILHCSVLCKQCAGESYYSIPQQQYPSSRGFDHKAVAQITAHQ